VTPLEPVVFGPALRPEGRNYGLRRSPSSLTGASRAYLQDFALSLSEWAKQGDARFELMLWLPRDELYLLLKGAHLGRGTMGPIAVAQGLLLTESMIEAVDLRSHRLLPLIPEPSMEEWGERPLDWDVSALPEPGGRAGADLGDVTELALELLERPAPWPSVYVTGEGAAAVRLGLLDAIEWRKTKERPSWLIGNLPAMGRFDPAHLALRFPQAGQPLSGDYRIEDGRATGGQRGVSPAMRLFYRLFRIPDERPESCSNAALFAVVNGKWAPAYAGEPPDRVVAAAIDGLLEAGLSTGAFWDVLEILARNAEALAGEEERAAAAGGIATFFSASAPDSPGSFAPQLELYMDRVWPHLPGETLLPLTLALERDVLGRIQPDYLARLLRAGIALQFPDAFCAALRDIRTGSAGGEARWTARSAVALVGTLERIEAEHGAEAVPLCVLAAAAGLASDLFSSPGAAAEPGLRSAVETAAAGLADAGRQAQPDWFGLARFPLARAVRLLAARAREAPILLCWARGSVVALREDPLQLCIASRAAPSPGALARLVIVNALVAAPAESIPS
jgi:hypothetical protein